MTTSSNANESKDYYEKGSTQETEVTAVTLKKLAQRRNLTGSSERLVIVLVGLPGRGKSFIARKLQSFLTWRGNECKIFNVGKYRRQVQKEEEAKEESTSHDSTAAAASGDAKAIRKSVGACDANFFDSKNPKAKELREKSAAFAMKDMLAWLDYEPPLVEGGRMAEGDRRDSVVTIEQIGSKASFVSSRIAIFDATNSTVERRKWVLEEATSPEKRAGKKTGCVFVESICDDQELLDENFRFKVRNSPDFQGMTEAEAIDDLRTRCQKYEEAYETVDDDTQSYIKIFNLSSKLLVNHIYGRMAKVIVPCLMSWNIGSRPIYLIRAGETMSSSQEHDPRKPRRVSRGDKLGPRGRHFRNALENFMRKEGINFAQKSHDAMKIAFAPQSRNTGTSISGIAADNDKAWLIENDSDKDTMQDLPFNIHIMSSTMPRAVETASWESMPFRIHELPNLNPLDKGDYSGMELEEIQDIDPEWYATLEKDPFLTRFPGGECYADLIQRLETCIIDMEQQVNMACVVSHISVLQVLMAYFRRTPVKECTSIEVPMHTVIKYTPVTGGGWTESMHKVFSDHDLDVTDHNVSLDKTAFIHGPIWGDHNSSPRNSIKMSESFDNAGCTIDENCPFPLTD